MVLYIARQNQYSGRLYILLSVVWGCAVSVGDFALVVEGVKSGSWKEWVVDTVPGVQRV